MKQPGRKYTAGSQYRYGFNGKENDNEVKGEGNQISFDSRIYDPRLGRWLSTDPLQKKYSDLTPYNFSGNSPIIFGDYDGKDFGIIYDHKNKKVYIVGTFYVNQQEKEQATRALNNWNANSAVADDGYTIIFALKAKVPEMQTKEQFVKSSKSYSRLSKSNQEKIYKQYVDSKLWTAKETDGIGNAYYGSDYISSTIQTAGSKSAEGGATEADFVYMNTADDGTDLAENSDLVSHEFGHTLGLQDPPKSSAGGDKKLFHSTGGIMEYTNTGNQLPINSNDVKMVYKYAKANISYQVMKALIPYLPANNNFENRAKVGTVTTKEKLVHSINKALTGISF